MQNEDSSFDKARIRNLAVLALWLFLMPAVAWFTGAYVLAEITASVGDVTASSQRADGGDPKARSSGKVALCESTRASTSGGTVDAMLAAHRRTCEALTEVRLVRHLAVWTAAVGALLLVLIVGARRYAGTDRARMAQVFGPVVQVVVVLLAASTLAQAGLFVYSVFAIEMLTLHGVHFGVLVAAAAAAAAVTTCYALLRSAFGAMKDEPLIIQAVALNRAEHPAVFRLVDDTAATLNADVPDHIVLGLEPTFFVTISDVVLAAEGREVLRGRTLFLSLSLMGVFAVDELRGVIGHELGHFRGDDLSYSLKFAPMYSRLRRAILSLHQGAGLATEIGRVPALAALSTCLLEFAAAERTVGREREMLADRAATEVAVAKTYAIGLVKGALLTSQWDEVNLHHVEMTKQGQGVLLLAEDYVQKCAAYMLSLNLKLALQALADTTQLHLIDTHPALLERLSGLHTSPDDIEAVELQLRTPSAAATLLDDAIAIDERVSECRTKTIVAYLAAHLDA